MGAREFQHSIIATSATNGFNSLVTEAHYEKGNHPYNGTISTCELCGCIREYTKISKTAEKEAYRLIDKFLNEGASCKGSAYYINMGLAKMQLITVDSKRGTYNNHVYKEMYVCCVKDRFPYEEREIASKGTLKEAKFYAQKYALDNIVEVTIKKERKLTKGETTVGEMIVKSREIKSIPKNLKTNQKVVKYFKFIFFGLAFE